MAQLQQKPLAERLRPQSLDEIVGQQHLVGPEGVFRRLINSGNLPSIIFWGPPGVGKTTLAHILSQHFDLPFITLSAINAGVKDVRQVIDLARKQGKVLLFIDEIHRFNKAQQDSLLGAVEAGTITLIGATTENPSFEVISALLSRSQVFTLKHLEKEDLDRLVDEALERDDWLKEQKIELEERQALYRLSGGDARRLLNLLEIVAANAPGEKITNKLVESLVQQKAAIYDKTGEQHYDIISAFIKSIRGSDPNAALYWLARMVEGGEDPKFIARRLLILASEDIGNANPTALVLANNCFQAINVIGYPECELILAQCVTYLASSPKSNASYLAIKAAKRVVKEKGDLQVPLHIRNAPTKLMKELDYGKEYKYAHDYPGNFVPQEFLPDEISGMVFYDPGNNPREEEFRKRLKRMWEGRYKY
jgi:putative ATPase